MSKSASIQDYSEITGCKDECLHPKLSGTHRVWGRVPTSKTTQNSQGVRVSAHIQDYPESQGARLSGHVQDYPELTGCIGECPHPKPSRTQNLQGARASAYIADYPEFSGCEGVRIYPKLPRTHRVQVWMPASQTTQNLPGVSMSAYIPGYQELTRCTVSAYIYQALTECEGECQHPKLPRTHSLQRWAPTSKTTQNSQGERASAYIPDYPEVRTHRVQGWVPTPRLPRTQNSQNERANAYILDYPELTGCEGECLPPDYPELRTHRMKGQMPTF